ncbi:MAG: hypothetical protein QOF70_3254, partial [Acetobacteraceae bacterium]|nr:hypothetical protein [Acetobacteraceae bacterium]
RWRGQRTDAVRGDRARRSHRGTPCGPARRPTRICPRRSIPRHTTQKQSFDVLIYYPHHPQAGERVIVVREVHHAGSRHFVIESPDGTRGLLPEWMTELSSARRSPRAAVGRVAGSSGHDRQRPPILCVVQHAGERKQCRGVKRITSWTFCNGRQWTPSGKDWHPKSARQSSAS